MQRNYQNNSDNLPDLFIGKEIEHTPAYGKATLFVVGIQVIEDISEHLLGIEHIFFGANHSFNPKTSTEWKLWEEMISYFLDKNYLCSLDIPISVVEEFHEGGLGEYDNFIPQIRVPIPYIRLWNYNTMLKIDDIGFDRTNPGVWSHSLHTLLDRNKFTDWSKYKEDEIIK